MAQDDSFTLDQSIAAQKALRSALNLPEEVFPVEAFVGMVSDEIEQHRRAGKTDQDIVAIIEQATGKRISAEAIAEHYASPDQRHPHGE